MRLSKFKVHFLKFILGKVVEFIILPIIEFFSIFKMVHYIIEGMGMSKINTKLIVCPL